MSFGKFIGVFLAAMLLLSACGGDPQKAAAPAPPPQNAPRPTNPGPRGPQGQVGGGYQGPAQIGGQNQMYCDGRYCYIDIYVDLPGGQCAAGCDASDWMYDEYAMAYVSRNGNNYY